jgi:hypothetical protein
MQLALVALSLAACSARRSPLCSPAPSSFCKDTASRSEHHKRVVAAANAWVNQTARDVRLQESKLRLNLEGLLQRTRLISNFSSSIWPSELSSCPIFYPFSGVDLPTVHAFFPHASELFLVAGLPLGNFSCFLSETCRRDATHSAFTYLKGWMDKVHEMSFAGSGAMLTAFNAGSWKKDSTEWESRGVGLLPTLLVTMHLLTMANDDTAPLIDDFAEREHHKEESDPMPTSVVQITWRSCSAQLSYLSTWVPLGGEVKLPHAKSTDEWVVAPSSESLVAGLKKASHAVGLGERARITMFKAAEHMHQRLLLDNGVARWILDVSAATLHDETGLRPMVYDHDLVTREVPWEVRTYGSYQTHLSYEPSKEERDEWRQAFKDARRLPFSIGYHSSLLTAWRTARVDQGPELFWQPWRKDPPPPNPSPPPPSSPPPAGSHT